MRSLLAHVIGAAVLVFAPLLSGQELALPLKPDSVRFAVLGDTRHRRLRSNRSSGATPDKYRQRFPFSFALLLGDNLYGSERPQDYARKFEQPYKALLAAKIEFHATLGNHDDPNQRYYKPFNLGGERYRTFKRGNVRFFVLDSNYFDPEQARWLEKELQASGSDWKIPYFHHPLYTSATRGPVVELRTVVEPLFVKYGVDVVLHGTRAPVRTHQTAEGYPLLRRGRIGEAPERRPSQHGPNRSGVRPRSHFHADGNIERRTLFPGDQSDRRDDRQRRDQAERIPGSGPAKPVPPALRPPAKNP